MHFQKEVLLVDPLALPAFLYSCAMTEVLLKDSTIITEKSMGGLFSAQRVGDKLTPHERKAAAVARSAQLLDEFNALQSKPGEQAAYLVGLQATRNLQRGRIRMMFDGVESVNDRNDQATYYAAIVANDVQSVATVAVCAIVCGGPILAGAGIATVGSGAFTFATAGSTLSYFAVPFAFKSVMAYATADANTTLYGFVIGGVKDGIVTLGELSSKLVDYGKDKAIGTAASLMNVCIGQWGRSCMALATTRALLQKQSSSTLSKLLAAELNGDTLLRRKMLEDLAEVKSKMGAVSQGQSTIANSAVKGAGTNVWMKQFGGRFVPIAFLAGEVYGEVWRNQEGRQAIEMSGKRW